MTPLNIGFIGLGNMGAPMAANLARAGHNVTGFDTAGTSAEGVASAKSADAALQDADVVITMLPNGDILRRVAAQVIPEMTRGAVFIDCSTVDVESARAVAQDVEDRERRRVAAPRLRQNAFSRLREEKRPADRIAGKQPFREGWFSSAFPLTCDELV